MVLSEWLALVSAVAAFVTASMTVVIAIVGLRQLRKITEQTRIAGENQKKWASIAACERYDSDPVIEEATKFIWQNRNGPNDYSNISEYKREVIVLLNYLDSLAIGIGQKMYFEDIIRDHMEPIIKHAVENFVLPGHFPRKDLQSLIRLYERWEERPPRFQDEH
jgi:hypothetical protein